ncbi:MAG TPA: hypothetical protein VGV93_13130 [Acidimicrobiales bacterium]|nr:hypothetical protein [Acidimicrobiales bacterium]
MAVQPVPRHFRLRRGPPTPAPPPQRGPDRRRPAVRPDRPALDPPHPDPFKIGTEEGRRDWRRLLLAIERDLVLADARPGDLARDLADYLYIRSTGHFASLMTFITRGCRRAITSGQERLSKDLLDGIRNDEAAEAARRELQAARDHGLLSAGAEPRPGAA